MRTIHWLMTAVFALMLTGCAGVQTGVGNPEAKAAVAPTGKLRVAFLLVPLYATKDPATGDLRGIAPDLGRQLAQRLGVPFEPVIYPNPPALLGGTKSGQWDVALFGISAERAADMDFSAPLMEVEQGYLVRAGVPITTASEVDRAGVRVVVLEKGGADVILSQTLKSATIIRVKTQPESAALLDAGRTEVYAATKTALFGVAASRPGSRMLEGRFLVEPFGMAVPNGRNPAAAAYVGKFVEDAKAGGLVRDAIERAGLRGVVVAPLR
ncbi:MAG: transporter substrate-binding domain-containing protein [Betaproteobacteria bacterium]|nr:transporter substrate-binding domain-containing protein [Betaproteobacteria bacterium]